MPEANEDIIHLTADIVAAHVANNSVAVGDLATLIASVHGALTGLGSPAAEAAPTAREPKVSVRSSVKPDAITCMLCGSKQKTMKRHLMAAHQMSPADYRAEFGLKADYPMVAPDYSATRRTLAVSIGLGTKGRAGRTSGGKSAPVSGKDALAKARGRGRKATPAD